MWCPDAGAPVGPTGGTITGDIAALLAGDPARLVLGCTIRVEQGTLAITEIPVGVAGHEVVTRIIDRVNALNRPRDRSRHPDYLTPGQPLPESLAPVVDLTDRSDRREGIRIVLALRPGTDPHVARAWVESVWPVTVTVDCRLPAPMGQILGSWDPGDGSGLTALAALL